MLLRLYGVHRDKRFFLNGNFSRIFGIRKINNISSDLDKKQNDNIVELLELKSFLDELLKKNQYISKREFLSSVDKKKDVLHFFDVLIQSQMLENFCKIKQAVCARNYCCIR